MARAALGGLFALALSACQTPWPEAVLRQAVAAPEGSPVVAEAAPEIASTPLSTATAEVVSLKGRIAAVLVERAPALQPVDRARVAGAIENAWHNHHVDPVLALAVIHQESNFRPDAHGPGGSIGLMQVRPFVAADVARRHNIPWSGAKTLLDPAANVQIGTCYLGEMLEMFHDPALAIAAYNMGPYRVRRLVARGHSPKPVYLVSVLKHFQGLASEFGPVAPEAFEEALAE